VKGKRRARNERERREYALGRRRCKTCGWRFWADRPGAVCNACAFSVNTRTLARDPKLPAPPGQEERIARYAALVAQGLPLFTRL